MAAAEDHIEVEWQFATDDLEPAAHWLGSARVPGYVVEVGRAKDQHDTYYDTEDWRLNRAGFTCRVRTKGEDAELTLKSTSSSTEGMRSRREINDQLRGGAGVGSALAPRPEGPAGRIVRLVSGKHA